MTMIKSLFCLCLALLMTTAVAATATDTFTEGKQYILLPEKARATFHAIPGKVQVVEFFSYGCPGCYHTEPAIEKWLATKPSDVEFSRVPVVFRPDWTNLAKAYYTAEALGIENKITPALFKAIHKDNRDMTLRTEMEKFFQEQGISNQDFESAFDFSPGIDAQLLRGREMMQNYQVFQIPTIIINGKYRTDPKTAGGLTQFLKVLNFLIDKEKKAGKSTN